MRKSLLITTFAILISFGTGCAGKLRTGCPGFPAPSDAVLDAVDESPSIELKEWVYRDLQTLWEQLEARE